MIVQCGQCSTKFRLDDGKIRESGIKVRCSKCRNVFIVYPETPSIPSVPPAFESSTEDFFDSHSYEQQPEPSGDQSEIVASSAAPASPPDADDWFAPQPAEAASGTLTGRSDEFDLTFEPSAAEQPVAQQADAETEEFDFFDTSQQDLMAPVEADSSPLGAAEQSSGAENLTGSDGSDLSLPPGKTSESAEDGFAAATFEDLDSGVFADAGAEPPQFGEPAPQADTVSVAAVPVEPPPIGAEEEEKGPGGPQEELPPLSIGSRRRSDSVVPVVVAVISVVFVLVLAVGGFLFMSEGPEAFKKLGLGFVAELAGLQQVDEGSIAIRATSAEFVLNKEAGEVFVVRGEAVNGFGKPRASVQVRALVYNGKGEVVARKTAFCGNPLTKEQVTTLSLAKIDSAMNNQFGDSLSNLGVQPGKAIPFVVVIPQVSRDAAEYGVEVAGSTVASQ